MSDNKPVKLSGAGNSCSGESTSSSSHGRLFPAWSELKSKMDRFRVKAPWQVVGGTVVGTVLLMTLFRGAFGGPSVAVNIQVFPSSVELNKNGGGSVGGGGNAR